MRYYFHFSNESCIRSDSHGVELPGDEAAWQEAALVAYELWQNPTDRREWNRWAIHVTDGTGRHVLSVSLRDADIPSIWAGLR